MNEPRIAAAFKDRKRLRLIVLFYYSICPLPRIGLCQSNGLGLEVEPQHCLTRNDDRIPHWRSIYTPGMISGIQPGKTEVSHWPSQATSRWSTFGWANRWWWQILSLLSRLYWRYWRHAYWCICRGQTSTCFLSGIVKGNLTQNVLGVCTFDLQFSYVYPGLLMMFESLKLPWIKVVSIFQLGSSILEMLGNQSMAIPDSISRSLFIIISRNTILPSTCAPEPKKSYPIFATQASWMLSSEHWIFGVLKRRFPCLGQAY